MAASLVNSEPFGEELKDDFVQMKNLSKELSTKILEKIDNIKVESTNRLSLSNFLILLRIPQVRFAQHRRFRPWVFKTLFRDYPVEIKAFKTGKNAMMGTPCDYMDKLMPEVIKTAQYRNLNLIVTSFNGSYVGNVTHNRHNDLNSYETRIMNWYGSQNGIYFQEMIKKILGKI